MPIPITCPGCGAKANAPDTAAGKKVKCPKCQGIIGVPKPQVQEVDELEEEPVAPPPKSSSKGGKLVPRKPEPEEEEDFEDEPPRKKKALPPPEDDEEDFDEDEAPRKRKGGKPPADAPNRVVIAIVALLIGSLGIHKFMYGAKGAGLTMLLVTLLTCGAGGMIMGPIALIEAIMYLTKSDEDFYETYVVNKKAWF